MGEFAQGHPSHTLTQVPDEPFQIIGRERGEPIRCLLKPQPCQKLSGDLALTANRGSIAPTNFPETFEEFIDARLRAASHVYVSVPHRS
jgi:hypothetical protein